MIENLGDYAHPKKSDKQRAKDKEARQSEKDAGPLNRVEDAGKRKRSPLHSHPRSP